MINAKMTEKGNSIIYELDAANRELWMLKDNFFLMEKKMREEIHKDYRQEIIEKDLSIKKFKEAFMQYKLELATDLKSNIDWEVETIDPKMKAKANFYKSLGHGKNDAV